MRKSLLNFSKYFMLILATVIIIVPILIAIFTSFKSLQEIGTNPLGIPSQLQFKNYFIAWKEANLLRAFLNSGILAVSTVFVTIVFSSMAAYVLARFEFRGNKILLAVFLSSMMAPSMVYLIPRFLLMRDFHLINNLLSLILPSIANSFAIFMYVGFFKGLSKEVEEAAIVDGCNNYYLFYKIMFPLVKPISATLIIMTAMSSWNDFMGPLIYLPGGEVNTVMLACFSFFGKYQSDWNYFFAALISSIVPVMIMYVIFQKDVIKGIAEGAVKG